MLKQKQTKIRRKYRILAYLTAFALFLMPFSSFALIYASNFTYPMKNYKVVSGFGEDRGGIYHLGEDILGPEGAPIYNIGSGYVKHIGEHTRFGTVILIEHTLKNKTKIVSLYGHLRSRDVKVKEGQFVNKGQKIGFLGNPSENGGWVEHLHFGIRKGKYIDDWVYWGLTRSKEEFKNWYIPTKFIKGLKATSSISYNDTSIITGAGVGGSSQINTFNRNGNLKSGDKIFSFSDNHESGADVAIGNLDKDKNQEILVGAGPGSEPFIKVFDKKTQELQLSFLAYHPTFKGGVRVTTGDLNNDGIDEIITGAGPGGGPHIRVFNYKGNLMHSSIFPFDKSLRTGVDVASGDVDNDGKDEIIASLGPGHKPEVKVIQEDGKKVISNFLAYDENFRGGVRVATGDIDKDKKDEIITGAGPGGGPHVRMFESSGNPKADHFFPFHPDFRGGVDVSSFDYDKDGKDEIIASQSAEGQAWVRVYRYNFQKTILANFIAYNDNFEGGANIAGSN